MFTRVGFLDNNRLTGYILAVAILTHRATLDTVLHGATVRRWARDPVPASSLGIRDGRIVIVGSDAEVDGAATSDTRRIDLNGRTVLPAFVDSHTHFHRGSILRSLYLDFDAIRPTSVEDVLDAVRRRSMITPPGAWIQGDNLSALRLDEGRLPDRHDLDVAGDGRPMALRGIGKHVVAASSAALALAGIDEGTEDPAGGRIERDDTGHPTGILHERAKLRLDQSHPETVLPKPDRAERMQALRNGFASLHAVGVTTIHEMVRLPTEADDFAVLRAQGELGARIRLYYRIHESPLSLEWLEGLGIRSGLGDDWLRVLGVKISVDGFCIFRNAAVYEPYHGEPENCGLLRIAPDRLNELVARADRQGLQVAVHAVGARAVDLALEAFTRAAPHSAGPHRLEHAYVDVDASHLARANGLGLAWSTQPAFFSAYEREWAGVFGPERRGRLMPLALGHDLGLPILLNSDYPCAPIDPLEGIRRAVRHASGAPGQDPAGLDVASAWEGFTTTPATVAGEPTGGRLVAGAPADLVVFDKDPFERETDLADLSVRATMMDGTFVFGGTEVTG